MRIETKILSNLVYDEQYCRKVIPFIRTDYFSERKEAIIAKIIVDFFTKYNKPLTREILSIEVGNRTDINDKELSDINTYVESMTNEEVNETWMMEQTEKFCTSSCCIFRRNADKFLWARKILKESKKVVDK